MRDDEARMRGAGLYAEDFPVGTRSSMGSYPVTEEEVTAFARQWDPQFIHTDPERSVTHGRYGGLIASGIHTVAILQRLQVLARTDHWHVIAGRGIDRLRFVRPVRPGDVLTGDAVVTELTLEPEQGRGLVVFASRVCNQDGKDVLTMEISAYLEMRTAALPH
ncbi:MaoC/PaaZ C-terminal domain-containing protein [Micrococcus sp. NPDC078436]|uniref:MaoC/PaaZ C-terminal domain-containing protein n=1 Tax=Micrococcus sp. NPDC078436 TaxID=3154960 RepID=UPI00344C8F9A